ncbi:methionine-S-sulfoxide reductase [Desulfuromonas soudanensis]|uniref:Peptide methionine sulfoxide reductase MsrA n=1 Tax=Desulfuromonas soudanensis TaxID=1603606 RepID=A0A0M3QFI5_9BACT|nr:peptide-methionine (S)-S-oxide reductase MsrA [Desulfuromonas soudanensis]ALC16289.1 methionine-S-sulfoxide reductase [Desulfuromonas soudanensis]
MKRRMTLLLAWLAIGALSAATGAAEKDKSTRGMDGEGVARAIFAGGCFWCMEPPFEKLEGVISVTSGYIGGEKKNPTYKEVSAGGTGHVEAVQIVYDPEKVDYEKLLDVFWQNIDPTDGGGQFVDRGSQYRSAIFTLDDTQKGLSEESKERLARSGRFAAPIVTEIVAATTFYPAEEYHQDYYKKNPIRYKYYRWGSGRDQFLDRIWGEERKSP